MTEIDAPTPITPLRAADRCDRCGAQAMTQWENRASHDLLLCGHHTKASASGLVKQGFVLMQDQRHVLTNRTQEVHA